MMDDNLVEQKQSINERLSKLEERIKYLVLEARLDCSCIKCLRLRDQFNKFKAEIKESYPWLDTDPVPPSPPPKELPVFQDPAPPVVNAIGGPSSHLPAKHF